MTDLEDEMKETAERAKALGVKGSQPTDPSELVEDAEDDADRASDDDASSGSETVESSESSAASATLETPETSETEADESSAREPGGLDDHVYPNPDKELGSLIDTYENFNVYVPPEVKKEVNAFYKELDYEFSRESGDDLDKHWDFYTALFRAVLHNREIVREELGMTETE